MPTRPKGSRRTARLEPDPAQQDAIRTMRQLRATGRSLRTIAVEVAARHGGLQVSAPNVRAVLARKLVRPAEAAA